MTQVLIVEDQKMIRESLENLVARQMIFLRQARFHVRRLPSNTVCVAISTDINGRMYGK